MKPLHQHDADAAYVTDPALAVSQRASWERAFHAELVRTYAAEPDALTAAALPPWLSARATKALSRLTSALPSWAAEFIRTKSFPEPEEDEPPRAMVASPVDIADALAPTLATAAYAQHVLGLMAIRGLPYKQWVSRRDGSVRLAHADVDGMTVPLSRPFVVGGWLMQYPADARTAPIGMWINDRCVLVGRDNR